MTDTIRDQLNRANPNDIADRFRQIAIGDVLAGQLPQAIRRRVPLASPYVGATLQAVTLPGHSKAAAILRATSVAGSVFGELAPQAFGATPATGQCAVSASGDLVFLAADAITAVDVTYAPERGEEIEILMPVDPATGQLQIPPTYASRAVLLLSEAESLSGTLVQKMAIAAPAAGAPATGIARLDRAKALVQFAVADAVTRARIRLILAPPIGEDLDLVLRSDYSI